MTARLPDHNAEIVIKTQIEYARRAQRGLAKIEQLGEQVSEVMRVGGLHAAANIHDMQIHGPRLHDVGMLSWRLGLLIDALEQSMQGRK